MWQGREKCESDEEGIRNDTSLALKFGSEVSHLPKGDLTVCLASVVGTLPRLKQLRVRDEPAMEATGR